LRGKLSSLALPLLPFPFEFLLKLDDLVGKLFYFLLIDVREIIDMGVVELFDGLG
jgi:hypothetical protein